MMAHQDSSNVTVQSRSGVEVVVPSEFLCPITQEIMVHPMTTRRGHNFERSVILNWLSRSDRCPLTRNPMKPSDLISNRCLESIISGWRIQHDVPSLSSDELDEYECGVVTFMNVSAKKHAEVVLRASQQYQITLRSVMESSNAESSSSRRNLAFDRSSSRRSTTAPSNPVGRRSGENRRQFVSRILAAACRELDDL